MVLPGCGTHNNGNVKVETAVDIAYHLVGLAEVDGNIGLFQLRDAFYLFLRVVDGDDDFMLAGEGGFLHLVTHLSVSDNSDSHGGF